MTMRDFFELRKMISIAHHIPGRIRLKFDPAIAFHPAARALKNLSADFKSKDTGVTNARLNLPARSLVLDYDQSRIAPKTLDDFLTSDNTALVEQLAAQAAEFFGIELSMNKETEL